MTDQSLREPALPADIDVSFEFFPPKSDAAESQLWSSISRLEPVNPAFVSVTYGAGGSTRERTHRTVKRIVDETSLKPAAHLTCVGAPRAEVMEVVEAYAQAGIRHLVALRGDAEAGMGQAWQAHPDGYESSVDLISDIRDRFGDGPDGFEISVSAYPEAHPDSRGDADDMAFLKAKQDAGASRAITQFFFEPEPYFRLLDRAEKAGVTMPIIPGIMLQPNFNGLKRISKLCGASIPDRMHTLYEGLDDDAETRELITANVAAGLTRQLADRGVSDFHFYTLNRAGLALSTCRLLGLIPASEKAA